MRKKIITKRKVNEAIQVFNNFLEHKPKNLISHNKTLKAFNTAKIVLEKLREWAYE